MIIEMSVARYIASQSVRSEEFVAQFIERGHRTAPTDNAICRNFLDENVDLAACCGTSHSESKKQLAVSSAYSRLKMG